MGSLGRHSHVITSPPYVNAQDYFRNFKLELYLLEDVLPFKVREMRERFVGTERGSLLERVPRESIERDFSLAPELECLKARDPRLCAVVNRYLYDMDNAFDAVKATLDNDARLVVVCGDNLIGGVRVCTWKVLHAIVEEKGFVLFDRFRDPIRDRLLAPRRLGHRGLIKEEVVSAYRRSHVAEKDDGDVPPRATDHAMASDSCKAILGMSGRGPRYPAELLRVARDLGNDGNARKVECGSSGANSPD